MLKNCWILRRLIGRNGCVPCKPTGSADRKARRSVFRTEQGDPLEVFTTRPDTLWGVTFMVLAPEHPLVKKITSLRQQSRGEGLSCNKPCARSDIQREATDKEKTGVFTGGYAINPVNGERIPIWIADYVLMTYGTGAIMAVPAHDQRDFEFARKFDLAIRVVIQPDDIEPIQSGRYDGLRSQHREDGQFWTLTGTPGDQAFQKAVEFVEKKGAGQASINYRLRDWLISRQRYWGAPIPMVYLRQMRYSACAG